MELDILVGIQLFLYSAMKMFYENLSFYTQKSHLFYDG